MFNLQLFGDNDTITTASEVCFNGDFADGDTRLIKLKNPNESYCTAANAATLEAWTVANQPIVGDQTGTSEFTGFSQAYIEDKTTRKLDLT